MSDAPLPAPDQGSPQQTDLPSLLTSEQIAQRLRGIGGLLGNVATSQAEGAPAETTPVQNNENASDDSEVDDDSGDDLSTETFTTEQVDLIVQAKLAEFLSAQARSGVGQALGTGNEELADPDSSDPQTFEDVALATQTMFVEGTNLPASSKDARRIAKNYQEAGGDRFPIPTMYAVKASEKKHDKENGTGVYAPVSRFERAVRKLGVLGYRTNEDIFNENAQRSIMNKKAMELMNELQGTGNDSQIRALYSTEVRPGVWQNLHTGEEFSAADVAEARKYWFQDVSHFAAAFWYEINKSASETEFNATLQRTFELLNEAVSRPNYSSAGARFSDRDIAGILLGVGYAWKATHLSLKHLDYGINKDGLYEYRGVKTIKLIQEMSTKFRAYEMAGFSPVDIANLAFTTEQALQASIEFKDRPTSPEFIKSQFILQRAAKIVSDMRYASTVDPEGDDASAQNFRQLMSARGMLTRPAIRIGKEDKQIYLDGQPLRAGASAVAGAGWDQIAGFTDAACFLFPNLKYISREEASPLDKISPVRVERARQDWPRKEAERKAKWEREHGGSLVGFVPQEFDEEEALKVEKYRAAGIMNNEKTHLGTGDKKRLRKVHRKKLRSSDRTIVKDNNEARRDSNRENPNTIAGKRAARLAKERAEFEEHLRSRNNGS